MNWESFGDFLAMGGYGGYVWGSFGVTALIVVVELLLVAKRGRDARAQLPGAARDD